MDEGTNLSRAALSDFWKNPSMFFWTAGGMDPGQLLNMEDK
jgi:hypothetical protein